jgi:hypothetical protein
MHESTAHHVGALGRARIGSAFVARRQDKLRDKLRAFCNVHTRIMLAALVGCLPGCSNGVSDSDAKFVAAAMPPQFESFRMYSAVPDSGGPIGAHAHRPARLHQGCQAIIQSVGGRFRESVILENESAQSFDLDVDRTASGWTVTSDGLFAPSDDSAGLRTQFTNCVNALEDKFRAEPEKVSLG